MTPVTCWTSVAGVTPGVGTPGLWAGGLGKAARITPPAGEDRFTAGEKWLRDLFERTVTDNQVGLPGTGPVAFASFTFDPASDGSVLIVPRTILGRAPSGQPGSPPSLPASAAAPWAHSPLLPHRLRGPFLPTYPRPFRPTGRTGPGRTLTGPGVPQGLQWHDGRLTASEWAHAVAVAVGRITSGALRKVVLARDVFATAGGPIDARILLGRLAARTRTASRSPARTWSARPPSCWSGGRRRGDRAHPGRDLAPRSHTGRGRRARRSPAGLAKNTEEHVYAVASVRDALAPLCADLDIPSRPSLLKLANVHHLGTASAAPSPRTVGYCRWPVRSTRGRVCGTPAEAARN